MSEDFTTERNRIAELIKGEQKHISDIEEKIAQGDNRKMLAEKYLNVVDLTREMVDTLIDYITVGKRIPKTRNVPIEIHWNF